MRRRAAAVVADRSLGAPPASEGTQQRMKLIHQPDPALRQVHPALVKQGQRISGAFGLERTAITLQRGRRRPPPLASI